MKELKERIASLPAGFKIDTTPFTSFDGNIRESELFECTTNELQELAADHTRLEREVAAYEELLDSSSEVHTGPGTIWQNPLDQWTAENIVVQSFDTALEAYKALSPDTRESHTANGESFTKCIGCGAIYGPSMPAICSDGRDHRWRTYPARPIAQQGENDGSN